LEAIALIGTSFVLLSLYRGFAWAEERYQAVWYSSRQNDYSRKEKERTKFGTQAGRRNVLPVL